MTAPPNLYLRSITRRPRFEEVRIDGERTIRVERPRERERTREVRRCWRG